MDSRRRDVLLSLTGAAVAAGVASCSGKNDKPAEPAENIDNFKSNIIPISPPPLPTEPLLNRSRAFEVMTSNGVEAIICSLPQNIYYLTNHYPQLTKMGMNQLSYAILPRDQTIAPILVAGQFAFYLGATERATPNLVDVRLFTAPIEADAYYQSLSVFSEIDAEAYESFLPQAHPDHKLRPEELRRRELTLRASEDVSPTSEAALLKALSGLQLRGKRIAVDSGQLSALLERVDSLDVVTSGENLIRSIRLQKSSAEIEIARYAARANADAALAAAKTVRDGAEFQDLRQQYALSCAERSLTPSFMVIDGVIPDAVPGRIREGRSFLIDCVSDHQNYHGDYGRTVCVGEPTREIKRATDALSKVWDELLPRLKPGVRFSEIGEMASKSFEQQNSQAGLVCNPHSVGIHHTDEPSKPGTQHWVKEDLELLEGMVLSVDLPIVDVGLGGSGHLEDLVLIGSEGAELLNDTGDRVITV